MKQKYKKTLILFSLIFLWTGTIQGAVEVSPGEKAPCQINSTFAVKLSCTVYQPQGTPAGGVLFVHMLGRKKEDFVPLAGDLEKEGYCSLLFDLPGHPTPSSDEKDALDWREFGPSHFSKMVFDLERAWAKMVEECQVQGKNKIAIGAELGASLIMEAYLQGKIHPDGLVLLSPPLSIKGINTYSSLKRGWKGSQIPALILTDTAHTYFLYSAKKLKELMGESAILMEFRAYALGTYLLRGDLPVSKEILKFVKNLNQ